MSSQNSQKSIFSYVTDQTRFETSASQNKQADNSAFFGFFPQTRFANATQTVDNSTVLRGFTEPNSKCKYH